MSSSNRESIGLAEGWRRGAPGQKERTQIGGGAAGRSKGTRQSACLPSCGQTASEGLTGPLAQTVACPSWVP